MPTWIAFLRAVNVGKRKYPMQELRAALEAAGFEDVETHIQTGNVRFTTPIRSRAKVEAAVERIIEADRGFDVTVVALTPAELVELAADVETIAAEHSPGHGHYVSLLKEPPTSSGAHAIENHGHPDETAVVRGRAVHLLYDKPYHEAKVSNAAVEKAVGVATNRNAKVIRALGTKWGS
jgi:uncharacterized protein (DUF1697 family)